MIRSSHQPKVGENLIFCGVPEADYPDGRFHQVMVAEVQKHGQVTLTNGSRTAACYLWVDELSIAEALEQAEQLRSIDDAMLRGAI